MPDNTYLIKRLRGIISNTSSNEMPSNAHLIKRLRGTVGLFQVEYSVRVTVFRKIGDFQSLWVIYSTSHTLSGMPCPIEW